MSFHPEKLLSVDRTKMFRINFIIILIFCFWHSNAQDTIPKIDFNPDINSITISTSKLTNTFLFNGNAKLDFNFLGGNLKINQQYKGTTVKLFTDTTKIDSVVTDTVKYDTTYPRVNYLNITDNEVFNMKYTLPVNSSLSIVAENNWNYGSYNKLNRLNGTAGFRVNNATHSFFEIKGGLEKNNQIGFNYIGPVMNLDGQLSDYMYEDYRINSIVHSEYVKLKNNKKNADIDFGILLDKKFDNYDRIHIDVKYTMMFRDQVSFLRPEPNISTPVESWFDSKILSNLNFDFGLFENLFGKIDFSIKNNWKNRYFEDFIENHNETGINKKREIFGISFLGEIKYEASNFKHIAGLLLSSGDDENKVSKNYNISDDILNYYKDIERDYDNKENTTRFYLLSEWKPSIKDKVNIETSISLYQRDTPSEKENTDMDIFSSLFYCAYEHKFSNSLILTLIGNLDLFHQVYIKSKKSADNKWTRNIQLRSRITWKNKYFTMNPELEIFANYLVNDFEDTTYFAKPNISSRQISYRDSITIFLGNVLSLQSYFNIRYNEKSTLFWKKFSELPFEKIFEKFVKIMLSSKFNENYYAAIGFRYFSYAQLSVAPEIDIQVFLMGKSYISLQGWYEFQNINKPEYRQIPNFFLTTKIVL